MFHLMYLFFIHYGTNAWKNKEVKFVLLPIHCQNCNIQ